MLGLFSFLNSPKGLHKSALMIKYTMYDTKVPNQVHSIY